MTFYKSVIEKNKLTTIKGDKKMKNMMDMVGMIKKAQAVQTQMAAVQNKMENTEFTGLAANGAVEVVLTGKLTPVKVKLDKSVVNPDDVETLEDLILVAMTNAKERADDASDKAFESIKKSLNLPDNFELPF